jgi:tRNA-dihydrouridine synthase A
MDRRLSVAPLMDWTDRHDRYFLRLIAPQILLYTEMLTAQALVYGDYRYLLQFDPLEHPVALQLGGSEPPLLAQAALRGEDFGYDEINLNVGCPSDRVQSGRFGACLMLEPQLVADCVAAMRAAVKLPVTVKCRIGVDEWDSYEQLTRFVRQVASAGCEVFIVHARKAWLKGLSPKENREIPPLRYELVRQLKKDFPQLTIIMNGGIKTLEAVTEHLQTVDGVMIGREAYSNPYFLAQLNRHYFPEEPTFSRIAIIEKLLPYIQAQLKKQTRLSSITRHILGLFRGEKGANYWRRYLSENAHRPGAGVEVLEAALAQVNKQ